MRPILSKKFRNKIKRFESRRKGWDTYIDTEGDVRYARKVSEGQTVHIPVEHLARIKK